MDQLGFVRRRSFMEMCIVVPGLSTKHHPKGGYTGPSEFFLCSGTILMFPNLLFVFLPIILCCSKKISGCCNIWIAYQSISAAHCSPICFLLTAYHCVTVRKYVSCEIRLDTSLFLLCVVDALLIIWPVLLPLMA